LQPASSAAADHGKKIALQSFFDAITRRRGTVVSTWVFTPADITAWIGLEKVHQKQYEEFVNRCPLFASGWAGDGSDAPPPALLSRLAVAMVYARAAYGYPMSKGHMSSISAQFLMFGRLNTGGFGFDAIEQVDDASNNEALTTLTGLGKQDIVCSHWATKTHEPAHFVALDHVLCWIVIGVRGTLTLSDVFTDLDGGSVAVKLGDAEGYVHEGVWLAASWMVLRLVEPLQQLMVEYPDYQVVVTGHSLGAAVAGMVGLKLRHALSDASLQLRAEERVCAYLFACPCICTDGLANACKPWTTGVVVEKDMIPRASILHADHLITELSEYGLTSLLHDASSKVKDATARLFKMFGGKLEDLPERALTQSFEVHYAPGRLIHVEGARRAAPLLLCARNEDYDRILVSMFGGKREMLPTLNMVGDHFPDLYVLALVRTALKARDTDAQCAATMHVKLRLVELLGKIPAMPTCIAGATTAVAARFPLEHYE
jgi:hypothetical protein